MLKVDVESFASSCTRAVSCDDKASCDADQRSRAEIDYDPPESFWLSKDAEFDWFDQNAFLERKDSTRRNYSNIKPGRHGNPSHSGSNSNSQRFPNMKSKASILGLPMTQKVAYEEAKVRWTYKPVNTGMLFSERGNVKAVESSVVEPSSPKVSWYGRVRSKRDKNRRMRFLRNSKRSSEKERSTRKSWLFARVRSLFRRKTSGDDGVKSNNQQERHDEHCESPSRESKRTDILDRLPVHESGFSMRRSWDGVTTGPEEMKHFTSGRRSAESLGVAGSLIDF